MKDDKAYIEHILECITKINEYTKGIDKGRFEKSEMVQDAVILTEIRIANNLV